MIASVMLTTIQVVRNEIAKLMQQLAIERDPERIRALGDVLEKLNARHERLEKELIEES